MTPPPRTGLLGSPVAVDHLNPMERAVWAEANGYESVWLGDANGGMDNMTLAAGIACRTSTLRVCLGIVPVFTRSPAVIAASAMTLSYMAPGRIALGLGASSPGMMQAWHGVSYGKPLTRLRETAALVRQMLAGERVNFEGETVSSRGYRLALPVQGTIPIYMAALRPKMLEMAGEHAEGVELNLYPRHMLPRMLEHVDTGAKRSGKRVDTLEIAQNLRVFVTDDPAGARDQMRLYASIYFGTPGYNRFLAWCGYEREAAAIAEAWRERDRNKAFAAMSDEMIEEFAIIGDADHCRDRVRRYVADGITTPVIECSSEHHGEYIATLEAFSAQGWAGGESDSPRTQAPSG